MAKAKLKPPKFDDSAPFDVEMVHRGVRLRRMTDPPKLSHRWIVERWDGSWLDVWVDRRWSDDLLDDICELSGVGACGQQRLEIA